MTYYSTHLSQIERLSNNKPSFAHPDYNSFFSSWEKIRYCDMGEAQIKNAKEKFLPKLGAMNHAEYEDYLSRATFHNMVTTTVGAYTGKLFRRKPKYDGIPKFLEEKIKTITLDKQSLRQALETTVREQCSIGRVGWLVDSTQEKSQDAYIVMYLAENIIDWEEGVVDGRLVLTSVTLREFENETEEGSIGRSTVVYYRKLALEDGKYKVYRYRGGDPISGPTGKDLIEGYPITPQINGNPLNYIPFQFFGNESNSPEITRPTVADIADMNIKHYQSYAQLEHGLFFTATPIYYVQVGAGSSDAEYTIGPSMVWEVAADSKPGILEFNGHGLSFLQNALDVKEQQIAALGGRMLGIRGQAVSESDNQVKLKEENEAIVLWSIANRVDEGFTNLLKMWAEWFPVSKSEIDKINIEINKDFMLENAGARELRAVHSMYKDKVIPVEVLYDYMRKSEVIPDFISLEEFKSLLENSDSFPADPDFAARKEGYPDAKTKLAQEEKDKQRKQQDKLADQQARLQEKVQPDQTTKPNTQTQVQQAINQKR